jgi:hypothetical protein
MGPHSSPPTLSEDLESSWSAFQRAKAISVRRDPPSLELVERWAETLGKGQSLLAIDSPSGVIRNEVYRWCYFGETLGRETDRGDTTRWLTEGAFTNFVRRVRLCDQERPWGLFWQLLHAKELTVAEPLYALVDEGSCFTTFFRAIWEARFLLTEKPQDVRDLFGALSKWLLGETILPDDREVLDKAHVTHELSPAERIETLFFLLALAHQNGIFQRIIFVFDGLDRVFRQPSMLRQSFFSELHDLTSAAQRWAKLGSNAGLVFGLAGNEDFYKDLDTEHSKLAKLIQDALV